MDFSKESIKNIEQAKMFFLSMGCSYFHMIREYPQRVDEYKALDIDPIIESNWIKEEFENRIEKFHSISPYNYGFSFSSLVSIIERKEIYLEKLLDLLMKIVERIPLSEINLILLTIIGNNATKTKGGLIQKSYDLKRRDLASEFYNQAKKLIQKAEESSVSLVFIRGYLLDIIEYYNLKETKEFLMRLQAKDDTESYDYFHEGAGEGNIYCMKKLSEYYREGKGCSQNIAKAKYWELKAKNQNQ